jgi:hypothetical protein
LQQAIVSTMQGQGIVELTFMDYLTYMPLFLEIHDNILARPLDSMADS